MDFISHSAIPLEVIEKNYNPYLICLSVVIAIISSFTAFGTSERAHASTNGLHRLLWIIFGATSMGIGIWGMHFIGSLALRLPIPVSYNLTITVISVVPAILASSVVLWLLNQASFNIKRLLFSGLLLGSGIGAMHYIGMAAMELNARMVYLNSIFILSILVAVILATSALLINVKATQQEKYQFINRNQVLSALMMGIAVSGMHYTAMQAVIFIPDESKKHLITGIDTTYLSGIVSTVVFLIITVAMIVPHMLRIKHMVYTLHKNEENLKIAAIAFQTHEAIMVTDGDSKIIRVNDAFSRILGYSEAEILGKYSSILNPEKQEEFFGRNFYNIMDNEEKWSGEVSSKRKNGGVLSDWQTISAVKNKEGKITHYISIFSGITEFKLAEKEIEKLAFYDSLTDLPNRRLLNQLLEYELNIAKRYQRTGILFFLDLDRFKHVNDSLGHSVGDQLLIETAKRLQSLLRKTDTVVRLGGDEFILLVCAQEGLHAKIIQQSKQIANKIISALNKPYLIGEYELYVSTSIGIALFSGIDETVDSIVKFADTAMYKAKDAGRNTFYFYQKSMQEAVDARLRIERLLRVALSKNELSLHYQPQISSDKKIVGAEALIRWQNAELGIISPVEFIPVAEESDLIRIIGQWIIETVCEQIISWENQKIHIPHIAINISAKQFHHSCFVSMLENTVFEKKVKPSNIMLEITEGVFLGNLEDAVDKMNVLKQSGFSFSIDDFGTGYSSLTYVKRLPFDQLKIDQSFVRDQMEHPADAAIVKAIIVMANSMGLNLIAEGVETKEHLEFLLSSGCNNYQGYYFSKPLPVEQFTQYIRSFT